MTKAVLVLVLLVVASPALALEPIPGSITYGGGSHPKLQKSPVGSSVLNVFESGGSEYEERYVVMPDRTLRLVSRARRSDR
jgi:hypothetical protein